ncbi:MAG: hypothetical protein JWQ16_1627 [Novosphingobium sp.]|nr:hypothetical protein [Novosphingobium sp.]
MNTFELCGESLRGPSLAHVLLACTAATGDDAAALLRNGYAAIAEQLALTAVNFGTLPPPTQFEAMLLCGAQESAALALLPRNASFMLSRGANGRHLGSVFMAECGEHTVEGNTAALAVMAATLSAWRGLFLTQMAHPGQLN